MNDLNLLFSKIHIMEKHEQDVSEAKKNLNDANRDLYDYIHSLPPLPCFSCEQPSFKGKEYNGYSKDLTPESIQVETVHYISFECSKCHDVREVPFREIKE